MPTAVPYTAEDGWPMLILSHISFLEITFCTERFEGRKSFKRLRAAERGVQFAVKKADADIPVFRIFCDRVRSA